MAYRIGVDIGGSFTDFVVFDEGSGRLHSLKVFSRPDLPGAEVVEGMRIFAEREGIDPKHVNYFTHGTTVGINSVIQRKGLKLGLITTRHFEDVLELARLKIADMYNLQSRRPPVLIRREHVFSVDERLGPDGSVEVVLDETSAKQAVRSAIAAGCEGIVVALLHSYRDPVHEHAVQRVAAGIAPGLPVVCSSDVWPIIREYERTITAVVAGYVQPRIRNYLTSLQDALQHVGVVADLHVTKSNGGVMSAEQAKANCIHMVLSGTASGVIGAAYVADLARLQNCLSLDIGGTSADVALIVDGQPQFGTGEVIGDFQVFIPSVAVSSVGDGGGSVAWVDEHGVLKVGPESAGSTPGPACYGRGGTRATITDAFAVNGWIGHAALGYDAVRLDVGAAEAAIGEIGRQLGMCAQDAASAIIDIAVSGMYSGISGVVSRYGIEPRTFSLLAFGGAGPMLACFIAREVGIGQVLIPTTPGVLSALGGLIADLKNDFVRTVYVDLSPAVMPDLARELAELRRSGEHWLTVEQKYTGEVEISVSADLRYKGQSFEIETALREVWFANGEFAAIVDAFHLQHEKIYGHSDRQAPIQVVTLRIVASGRTPKPRLNYVAAGSGAPQSVGSCRVWIGGRWQDVPLYSRSDLLFGHCFDGPAVVMQSDCTSCILPDFTVKVDEYGNLRVNAEQTGTSDVA